LKVNWFDLSILRFLNQFAQNSDRFDKSVGLVAGNVLLEGGFLTALFWWAWYRKRESQERDREFVTAGMVLAMMAVLVSRLLAILAPFRVRPRYVPSLHFRLPSGSAGLEMFDWSSFPSDHAALFFCGALILWFISRKAGLVAFLHALFFASLTRVYLGIHYPTDILGGMLIGCSLACLALNTRIRQSIARPAFRWMRVSPQSFYPSLFLFALLVATMFDPLRDVLVDVWRAAKHLSHG